MAPVEISRAKIRQPYLRSDAIVPRGDLSRQLGQAMSQRRAVLVQALAGYGKSCSVSRALDALPGSVAKVWVSLDDMDSLRSLVECLAAALEPFDAPWRSDPVNWAADLDAIEARGLGSQAAAFLNALSALDVTHAVIVFDDLHRLSDAAALRFIELLVDQLGERWTVVLCTRANPPFSLARIAAAGELATFRDHDLSLSLAETRLLCSGLPEDAADAIWRLTRGWPAGVRLAMNAGPTFAQAASHGRANSAVFEFLIAEVIDTLPDELRLFLLQIAVLPEVTLWQAEALTGNPGAAQLLEQIERRSLFVADVGGAERVLRFHDLFREALNRRLLGEPRLDRCQLLRQAAALEPDPIRRVDHLLEARAWSEAAAALARLAPEALLDGHVDQLQRMLGRLPPPLRQELPGALSVAGLVALERWDWATIAPVMKQASAAWRALGETDLAAEADSHVPLALAGLGDVDAARAHLAAHEDPQAPAACVVRLALARSWIDLATGALDHVGAALDQTVGALEAADAPATLWKLAQPLPAFVGLPGTRAPLLRWIQGACRRAGDAPSPLKGMAWVLQGWLAVRAGDRAAAWRSHDEARSDCEWLHRPMALTFQLDLLKAQLLAADVRNAELEAHLTLMLAANHGADDSRHRQAARGLALYLGCRTAHQAGATSFAARLGSELLRDAALYVGWIQQNALAGLRAIVAEAAGDRLQALEHWLQQVSLESSTDLYGQSAEARLHAAFLAAQLDDEPRAASLLQPLLLRCTQDGEPGLLMLAHPGVRSWAQQRPGDAGTRRMLEALVPRELTAAGAPREAPAARMGLSSREVEVLAMVARGDANKQIARHLGLSPFTVKRHVANILTKLDLQSRGQAAAWFRDARA